MAGKKICVKTQNNRLWRLETDGKIYSKLYYEITAQKK